jgi:putative ABC transport system ATP-binding protein
VALTPPLLEAKNLFRFFHSGDDETLALQGVSLTVSAGELVVVTGPAGSGKSTLLACMAGLDDPDGGSVWVEGTRLSRRPEAERTALRLRTIGMLFQSGNLFEHLTVCQNLALVQRLAGAEEPERIDSLLTWVGLRGRRAAYPSQLSGGEAARAGLAVALANRPRLVLADEPTGEVDSLTEQRLLDLFRAFVRDGAGAVIVTHSPSVTAAADRRVSLLDGRLVG